MSSNSPNDSASSSESDSQSTEQNIPNDSASSSESDSQSTEQNIPNDSASSSESDSQSTEQNIPNDSASSSESDSQSTEQNIPNDSNDYTSPSDHDPSDASSNSQSFSDSRKDSQPLGLWIGLIVAVGVAAFFAGAYMINSTSDIVSNQDLADALASLEARVIDIQSQQPTQDGNTPSQPIVISIDDDPIIGDPDAPINIIEFSDFQCPFCARFNAETLPLLIEEYIDSGKVKLVYRDFPLHNIHPNAVPAAVAAECADEQDGFKMMHDLIFDRQSEWSGVSVDEAVVLFSTYATTINLDQEEFDSCLFSGRYVEEIGNDLNDGRSYGIDGTPGFLIGNDDLGYVTLSGAQPFEVFQQIIDAQLGT